MSTQINRKLLFDENSEAIRDTVSPRLGSFGSIFFEEGWLVNKNPVGSIDHAFGAGRGMELSQKFVGSRGAK